MKDVNILDLRSTMTGLGNKLKLWENVISYDNFSVSGNLNELKVKTKQIKIEKINKREPI